MDQPGCSTDLFDLPEMTPPLPSPDSQIAPEKPQRHQRPTECSVCGIAASGYHYDIPSCNGCKTFFRRICISEKSFECKFNKDCYDLTKRKTGEDSSVRGGLKCRACRYQKCITSGMNPLALEVSEKDTSATNFKKLTKREPMKVEPDDDYEIVEKKVVREIVAVENKMQKAVDMLTYLEGKLEKFRQSAYNPHWTELPGLEFLLNTESRISLADQYGPMQGWPLKRPPGPPPDPTQRMKFMNPFPFSSDRKHWLFFNLVTTIEYAKTFMFFHKLDSSDKLILAKHVALACSNLLCSFSSVTKKCETIVQPDGTGAPPRHPEHYNSSVMSVAPLIRYQVQKTEYLLLKAICLCNPAVPGLSRPAQTTIAVEREKYADALFDHCLRNHRDGPSRFAHLIAILEVLERQQRMQKDFHLLHIAVFLKNCPPNCIIRVIEDVMDN